VDDGIVKALEGRLTKLEVLVTTTAEVVNRLSIVWEKKQTVQKPKRS
jgi:hypothetical protein